LKTEEGLWSARGRCSALELREATKSFMMVLPLKDLSSVLTNRSDSKGCKLQHRGFKLLNDKFSAPTSRLLALHCHHHRGTTMCKILVLWDHAIVMVRVGIMLIGVQGSRQIRLQFQAQIRTSTTMPTIVHLL
jgi:hypothetical protein